MKNADAQDVTRECLNILNTCASPADSLIAVGHALVKIGTALSGMPPAQARAVFGAAAALRDTCGVNAARDFIAREKP